MGKTWKDKENWKRKKDKREKTWGYDKPNRSGGVREEQYEAPKYADDRRKE